LIRYAQDLVFDFSSNNATHLLKIINQGFTSILIA